LSDCGRGGRAINIMYEKQSVPDKKAGYLRATRKRVIGSRGKEAWGEGLNRVKTEVLGGVCIANTNT